MRVSLSGKVEAGEICHVRFLCIVTFVLGLFGVSGVFGFIRSLVFLAPLYTIEAILKMWGLGLWRDQESYLVDNWCRFDLLVLFGTWIDAGMIFYMDATGILHC